MRRTSSRIVSVVSFATVLLASACDSGTGTPDENFTLALSSTSLAMAQGSTEQISVTIQRSNFDKPITLTVEGLPAGVSAAFSSGTLPGTASSTSLTVTVAGNAAPATSASFTVRAAGEGVPDQTQSVTLSVAITGTYTLGLLEPEVSAAQGGGGNATVLVTRSGGNAGDVSLSVGSLPAGVTATFAQATTTTGAGALVISVAADAVTGTHPITITSSSPGHTPDQTTTLSLLIVSAPPTASASLVFCSDRIPTWFAYRNEGFGWQQLGATGNTFTFNATERVSVAFVFASSSSSDFNIYHVQRAELAHFNERDCSGSRSYTGLVSGLSTGQSALVVMGSTSDLPDASSPSYALDDLANRPLDLVATRGVVTAGTFPSPDRIVLRRGIDLVSGSVIPELNFTAAESFPPHAASASVGNVVANSLITVQHTLLTATVTYGLLQYSEASSTPVSLYFVPADKQVASDVHELYVTATQSNDLIGQGYVDYTTTPGDRSVSLGPALATPTIDMVAAATYARPRATFQSQPEYSSVSRVVFLQSSGLNTSRFVTTVITDAYLGGTPQQWNIIVPDFAGAPGFSDNWMLARNIVTQYLTQAFGGANDLLFGAAPEAGDQFRFAYRQSSTTTSMRQLRADGPAIRRAPLAQYLRR